MFEHITDLVAEVIYDNDMHKDGYEEWVKWEVLDPEVQEDYLKIADEIIELIEDEI